MWLFVKFCFTYLRQVQFRLFDLGLCSVLLLVSVVPSHFEDVLLNRVTAVPTYKCNYELQPAMLILFPHEH
ncbi:hypothetical protein INR49_009993 [Caranx melampygus]|nr:hypothetical protein INR49_009993 [Caranx melampygus]